MMKKRLAKILDNSPNLDVPYHSQEEYEKAAEYLIENDVVEVVRCKDCKYYTEHYEGTYGEYGRCDHPQQEYEVECYDMWVATDPDDFCSYGERREE